jgi:hypothetical protein
MYVKIDIAKPHNTLTHTGTPEETAHFKSIIVRIIQITAAIILPAYEEIDIFYRTMDLSMLIAIPMSLIFKN